MSFPPRTLRIVALLALCAGFLIFFLQQLPAITRIIKSDLANLIAWDKKRIFSQLNQRTRSNIASVAFFENNYQKFGPDIMLDVLNQDPFCHSRAHNLGRVIYGRTQDLAEAVNTCRNRCSAGCIHGVLMGFFESEQKKGYEVSSNQDPSLKDFSQDLKNKVATMCVGSTITRYTGIGNCYHAVGHALAALASYDIAESIRLCDIFKEDGIGPLYYCMTGVYMERDISMGNQDAKTSSGALYPCDKFGYAVACFRYKMRRLYKLPAEHEQATQTCLSLAGVQQRRGCFHGLGFGGYMIVYNNPSDLNMLCGAGDEEDKRMCIEGALGYINIYHSGISKAACESYTAGKKESCAEALRLGNFGMERDFKRYSIDSGIN